MRKSNVSWGDVFMDGDKKIGVCLNRKEGNTFLEIGKTFDGYTITKKVIK